MMKCVFSAVLALTVTSWAAAQQTFIGSDGQRYRLVQANTQQQQQVAPSLAPSSVLPQAPQQVPQQQVQPQQQLMIVPDQQVQQFQPQQVQVRYVQQRSGGCSGGQCGRSGGCSGGKCGGSGRGLLGRRR